VSVPTHNSGLPIGLQIIGPQTADSQVLAFARTVEELNA